MTKYRVRKLTRSCYQVEYRWRFLGIWEWWSPILAGLEGPVKYFDTATEAIDFAESLANFNDPKAIIWKDSDD